MRDKAIETIKSLVMESCGEDLGYLNWDRFSNQDLLVWIYNLGYKQGLLDGPRQ